MIKRLKHEVVELYLVRWRLAHILAERPSWSFTSFCQAFRINALAPNFSREIKEMHPELKANPRLLKSAFPNSSSTTLLAMLLAPKGAWRLSVKLHHLAKYQQATGDSETR